MHTLSWGKAIVNFGEDLYREVIFDDEIIANINMDEYLDASIQDSFTNYNNTPNLDAILKEVLGILSDKMSRRVSTRDFRRYMRENIIGS